MKISGVLALYILLGLAVAVMLTRTLFLIVNMGRVFYEEMVEFGTRRRVR